MIILNCSSSLLPVLQRCIMLIAYYVGLYCNLCYVARFSMSFSHAATMFAFKLLMCKFIKSFLRVD